MEDMPTTTSTLAVQSIKRQRQRKTDTPSPEDFNSNIGVVCGIIGDGGYKDGYKDGDDVGYVEMMEKIKTLEVNDQVDLHVTTYSQPLLTLPPIDPKQVSAGPHLQA
jgi:hypothetical protein